MINEVVSGKVKLNTAREKGNFSEMLMDQRYESEGYVRIDKKNKEYSREVFHIDSETKKEEY